MRIKSFKLGRIQEYCRKCGNKYNYGHLNKVLGKNEHIVGYICNNCKKKT